MEFNVDVIEFLVEMPHIIDEDDDDFEEFEKENWEDANDN